MAGKHVKKSKRFSRLSGNFLIKPFLWLALGAVVFFLLTVFNQPRKVEHKPVVIYIRKGLNSRQIANLLVKHKVVANSLTFRIYASYNQVDYRLLPGTYQLKTNMPYNEVIRKLTKGPKKSYVKIVIPEGFTLKEIVARLSDKTGRPAQQFYQATQGNQILKYNFPYLPAGANSLEGYLFPKTYTFETKVKPRQIIERMLRQFKIETQNLDWSLAEEKSMSRHEMITIASLIEKEAKVPEERPLVAAVIYNRLARNMPLQIDATVQYALPERKTQLNYQDYKVNSPYNTYLHTGLPPGPIASPGLDSINAALHPAAVDYLYYVLTSPDGRHTFTNNYQDFLKAKKQAGL